MARVLALLAALLLALAGGVRAGETTVFAAASLTDAMEEIGAAYRSGAGSEVRFSFASSSTLARQIEAGAPADLFASADESWMDYLEARGLIEPGTRVASIGNTLALIAPAGSPLTDITLERGLDLLALLGPDGFLAVGDPDHVPAGKYARQALLALGLWERAAPRLARADNVRAALALVERAEAPLGIVYATDARASAVKMLARFPDGSHVPIVYPFALVRGHAGAEARAFLVFLLSEEGKAIFARHGFTLR